MPAGAPRVVVSGSSSRSTSAPVFASRTAVATPASAPTKRYWPSALSTRLVGLVGAGVPIGSSARSPA